MKGRVSFLGFSARVIFLAICAIIYLINFTSDRADTKVSDSPYTASGDATVAVINSANSQILVQACSFTSLRLAKALVDAHNRGVSVSVILDKAQQEARQYAVARYLTNAKISTFVEDQPGTSGDSFMIIDGETVVTGSFDSGAESPKSQRDNLSVTASGELAKTYLVSWQNHKDHSDVYLSRF